MYETVQPVASMSYMTKALLSVIRKKNIAVRSWGMLWVQGMEMSYCYGIRPASHQRSCNCILKHTRTLDANNVALIFVDIRRWVAAL